MLLSFFKGHNSRLAACKLFNFPCISDAPCCTEIMHSSSRLFLFHIYTRRSQFASLLFFLGTLRSAPTFLALRNRLMTLTNASGECDNRSITNSRNDLPNLLQTMTIFSIPNPNLLLVSGLLECSLPKTLSSSTPEPPMSRKLIR